MNPGFVTRTAQPTEDHDIATPTTAIEDRTIKAIISPYHEAVLDQAPLCLIPVLSMPEWTFDAAGPTGCHPVSQDLCIYRLDDRGRLVVPAGLLQRVEEALAGQGYQLQVEDLPKGGPKCPSIMRSTGTTSTRKVQRIQ